MSTKLLAAALLLCSTAYAQTNTRAVGTATVRGNIRVDGNQIASDATIFEGSTVETAEASTTLQLGSHSVIIMTSGTRSIVHDDYVKLEQGKLDVKPTCGFVVEVPQVRITPNSTNSHGVISISDSSVSVMVQEGEFLVLDNQGRMLGNVRSGNSQSFATGQSKSVGPATYVGTLSSLDTHPMLTLLAPDNHVKYELHGRNTDKIQGKLVQVNGTVDPKRSSFFVDDVIDTKKESAMCTVRASPYPWLLGGAAAAALGGGIAAAVVTNQPSPPASR